jgi:hypothetical protein
VTEPRAPSPGLRSRRAKGLAITVRLFPQVHGALLEELAGASRGSRAARVVYLMTVGLTLERALQAARTSRPPPAPLAATSGVGINDADGAFLGALLDGVEGLGDDAELRPRA